ncbi:hypothetical protein DFJ74DRAFT_79215 [Hyaloraphidium curvatum]|nr:hypothetical protein DFJ74DRAFT_79215 [Hyaloraphidium curvatum]
MVDLHVTAAVSYPAPPSLTVLAHPAPTQAKSATWQRTAPRRRRAATTAARRATCRATAPRRAPATAATGPTTSRGTAPTRTGPRGRPGRATEVAATGAGAGHATVAASKGTLRVTALRRPTAGVTSAAATAAAVAAAAVLARNVTTAAKWATSQGSARRASFATLARSGQSRDDILRLRTYFVNHKQGTGHVSADCPNRT